jgi:hypothetical protein
VICFGFFLRAIFGLGALIFCVGAGAANMNSDAAMSSTTAMKIGRLCRPPWAASMRITQAMVSAGASAD